MKYVMIALSIALVGCATKYQGPGFVGITKMCQAKGHTMRTLADCQEDSLNANYPNWRNRDEDGQQIDYLITYARTLGDAVKEGRISNDAAYQELKNENNRLYEQKIANKSQSAARANALNAAALIAGSAILLSNRPSYAPTPVLPTYPSDTVIIQQNQRPYRFIDSSPYR